MFKGEERYQDELPDVIHEFPTEDTAAFYIIFDVKCKQTEPQSVNWIRNTDIDDQHLVIFEYEGPEGCIKREFLAIYIY